LTTVADGNRGDYGAPPNSSPFPVPYVETFESNISFDLLCPLKITLEVLLMGSSLQQRNKYCVMLMMIISIVTILRHCDGRSITVHISY